MYLRSATSVPIIRVHNRQNEAVHEHILGHVTLSPKSLCGQVKGKREGGRTVEGEQEEAADGFPCGFCDLRLIGDEKVVS